MVRHREIERIEAALRADGIGCKAYYRRPTHRQPAMARWGEGLDLPGTEEAARTNLALPMSPVLSADQVASVTAAVGRAVVAAAA